MAESRKNKILERGDIYFFYRPKVHGKDEKDSSPRGLKDIQRFYIVLHPEDDFHYRLLFVGRKHLPDIQKHEKEWATVDLVARRPEKLLDTLKSGAYSTKTRGKRQNPEARSCGEGVYCIVNSGKNTYLAYQLVLPKRPHSVQKTFNLLSEASYAISVKNQSLAGRFRENAATFPEELQKKFHDLRFLPVNPVKFLNYPGAEFLLIGAKINLGKDLDMLPEKNKEDFNQAKIFKDLKLWKNSRTIKPLFEGKWA